MVRNLSLLLLGVFIALCNAAYDITRKIEPAGKLGVGLDLGLALSWPSNVDASENGIARGWVWHSHLIFKEDVSSITDGQLWQMALDAYDEAQENRRSYGIGDGGKPTAMAVMAWDKEIIFASSQKGSPLSYGRPSPVRKYLDACGYVAGRKKGALAHRTKARCAEPMAAHLYYSIHSDPLEDKKARIGTVVEDYNDSTNIEQTDPCPKDRNVSCHPTSFPNTYLTQKLT